MKNSINDNKEFRNIIDQVSGKKAVIWGVGSVGINAWFVLSKLNIPIAYFIDMDERKWGMRIGDACVVSMDIIDREKKENLVIFVCTGSDNAREICQVLRLKGVNDDNISLELSTGRYSKLDCTDMMLGCSRRSAIVDMRKFFGSNIEAVNREKRVVVLGSSTTDWSFYGIKSWAYFLQEKFIKNDINVQVLNGGIIGFQVFQEMLLLIRDVILPIRPDIVISYSGLNDSQIEHHPWKSQAYYNRINNWKVCNKRALNGFLGGGNG